MARDNVGKTSTMLVKPLRNWVKNLQETLRKIKKGKLCYYLTQAIAVTE
jgi:hypothetical protein